MPAKDEMKRVDIVTNNGGGGGGGESGEIPTFALQGSGETAYVQLSEGFAVDDGESVIFAIKSSAHLYLIEGYCRSTSTGNTITGVIISDDGRLIRGTSLSIDSNRRLSFDESNYQSFNWQDERYLHVNYKSDYGQSGDVGEILAGDGKGQYPRFKTFETVLRESGYVFEAVEPNNDLGGIISLLAQQGVFTAMETLSRANSETYVSRYMDISQMATVQNIKELISGIIAVVETDKKMPYVKLETNSLNWVKDYSQLANDTGMLAFEYSYWETDKKYVHEITLGYPKLYITTICHEATSLM